ncbi:tyrosine-protein phosphatase non-receptor type 22 isoform X2 [Gouania willdenowi]|uniref:tyrosine-protein phosphatase non-receptor type 22 isoform X2 n=1 Tax=Gouania willdenowi TaxID=441366 RepID=UPI0010558884|nr:tyrosine-protein phosphatase non-receptor type 22-like isoform X2 [Gouania willdenowi]
MHVEGPPIQVMEQQAQILRKLLENLENPRAEEEDGTSGIAGEFARLRSQSIKYRTDKIFTCKTAEKQVNTKKNRYKDIIPFDHSRVKLTLSTSKKDNDYINGSFIQGVSGSRAYIATQGPLPHTVVDFLRMLWEYDIRVVVNACREFEMGKKKCELYWPRNPDTPFVCEPFTVDLDSEEDKGDYITRMLRLTFHNSSRILKQLHYVKWPDHGVPDSIPPILEMLQEMRSYQTHNDIPICIHCSAGCGRTGALCVIDYTWNLLKNQMITSDFNIFDLVQTMRTQRPSVVQTAEQYELVYRTIKYLFEKFLQNIDDQIQENKAAAVPSSVLEIQLPNLSEDLQTRSQPLQHLLHQPKDESHQFSPDPSLSEPQQCHAPSTTPEDSNQDQDAPLELVPSCQVVPAVQSVSAETPPVVYLMVEDPYFDSHSCHRNTDPWSSRSVSPVDQTNALFSSSTSVHTVDDEPPPLPLRTPESFILAVDAESEKSDKRLAMNIPPCAADGTLGKLTVGLIPGGPPSPIPPLPEQMPQSFELASDQWSDITPASAVKLRVMGVSSEWPAATLSKEETGGCGRRSQSLKSIMTFTGEDDQTPPLPERTPESFLLCTENVQDKPYTSFPQRVGLSSEWGGTCQAKEILNGPMSRSKSVRAKSSRQEPLAAAQPLAPLPVVVARGGSVGERDGHHRLSLNVPGSEEKNMEKGMFRTKSLKFFKNKPKYHSSPSPPSSRSASLPESSRASLPVFNLGFGNRYPKPKGPRVYPESWV